MDTLRFHLSQEGNKFKILNATNGGPLHKRHATDQYRSNFADYKAARIPYSRNHDSALISAYGGHYCHDITGIFPDFDADPYNPDSYDFDNTDENILVTLEAGTKTFFRLGQSIEHQIRKHGTIPPKDFKKWAIICEHVIRHYTEGWANGFTLDMEYWEIWNEPDLDPEDATNKRTWGGTIAQFYDFYETAAKHLKNCFPHLKIGGPAVAYRLPWVDAFLAEMQKRNVPIDFFSWHRYLNEPPMVTERAVIIKKLLEKYGYGDAESILNEWNYKTDWTEHFVDAIKAIHGIKGATFVMGCICEGQRAPLDMMMYYDTRPGAFNGAFDFYTLEKLKGYYPLYWYGMFYDMQKEIPSENQIENIYSLCGVDENGKVLAVVTHFNDNDETPSKQIALDFGQKGTYEIYLLDKDHDAELVTTTDKLEFDMDLHSAILIKEI